MNKLDEIARHGYMAFGQKCKWKGFQGQSMVSWDSLSDSDKANWKAFAKAVLELNVTLP